MIEFISHEPACVILVALGIIALLITYVGAPRAAKKSGRSVSGIPAVGGLLVMAGFLTSSVKWAAVIGLFEPAILFMLFKGIPDIIRVERSEKSWLPPKSFEGGESICCSQHNKCWETRAMPYEEDPKVMLYHTVVKYVVIAYGERFRLIGHTLNLRNILLSEHSTVEACKKAVPSKVRWTDIQ